MLYSNILGELGKPLLVLHGFLGMSDNWKSVGKKYAKEGFQVHLVDQRNHGRSFHSEVFNYEVLAEDVKEYCEYHTLEEISLIGHSMGGKTAMNVAVKYPELIEKLIIADIGTKFYPTHHEQILAGLEALEKETLTKRSDADTILKNYVFEVGMRRFLLKNLYWAENKILALRLNLAALQANVEEIGEALSAMSIYPKKTLFLKGDASEYILPGDEDDIKKHFPDATIEEVTNAGHWLHAENPSEFFEKTLKFLNS